MSLRMTGSSDEWIKVSKAGGRDSRVSTASGERRSMSREDEGGSCKYSRDLCDNRDLRDESDESLAETEVYVSDENRWRKASEVFPDHPGDANGRRSRALSERRESGDIRQSLSRKSGFGDGDVNRPSVANRKSYADQGDRQSVSYRKSYASRDDEGDARRSVASRKSYTDDGGDRFERRSTRKSTFEDAGDARRASRKSYADVEDGDLRRSVMRKSEVDLGRDEEGGDVRRATRKSDVREEEGDNLRRSGRMSYASEGPIARQSVANRKSYASIQDSDLRRSVAARASYDLGRDDDGDARRSVVTRKSNREEEIDLNRRSLSRKSYAEEDAEAARLSAAPHMSRMSRSEGEEGPRASRAERRSRLEGAEQRMLSQPPEDFESEILMQDGFRRKSEAYVSDENRWRKASEVFPDHPGDANGRRSRAVSERRESGDIRQSLSRKSGFGDGDVNRPSVANRKSYADQGDRQSVSYRKSYASRDDEGDARRSVASRKSYTDDGGDRFERRSTRKSTFEDAGDARRASRKSYADVEDGDLGRSVMRKSEVDLGRDEEGGDFRRATRKSDVREEEGDLRRSVASRASYNDDEGDARRSVVTRKSTREEEIDMNRRSLSRKSYAEEGPRASRAERRSHLEGAEQRKLSQPPEDSESDILMQDGFRRKSEVRGPKARQMLTLELDADSPSEMKSIVWKFTERGACVKVLNKDCPEASPEMLRAGDLLALINGECVLDQPKAFIQKTWKEQQLEDRFVTLRFKPVDYVDYEV